MVITNDFDMAIEKVVRKYARRWLVEKSISEQVDFDLTMTILASNLYRLLARDLGRYSMVPT